ncbi:MAG: NAD(P)/FAD-dependent oxidoreductase [Saprospiraceae bacterium]
MSTFKFLVVGQGIAGTVLSWVLRNHGAEVVVADAGFADTASAAAAGIVNPITGKNYVKSWRIDAFLPAAKALYRQMEQVLGIEIWQERPILRLLGAVHERNNWDARLGLPDYEGYMGGTAEVSEWSAYLHPHFSFGQVIGGGRVDFGALLPAYRKYAREEGFITTATIQADALPAGYDAVIFCEGHRAAQNPLFSTLPWQMNKGEALLVRFPGMALPYPEAMLKKTILMAHVGEGLYWAGAPYIHRYEDPYPSPEGRRFVEEDLQAMFRIPYIVEDHVAGIRPAVAGRRPFVGRHPLHPEVVLFNGWGAKGASLTPYWAAQLAEHLMNGKPLDAEVTRWQ